MPIHSSNMDINLIYDQSYYNKLYQSIKTILGSQRNQWTCEQIIRFLTLIKVQSKLQTLFYQFKITGDLLFNIKYMWEQMINYIDSKNYFPIMKFLYVIKKFNYLENKNYNQNNFKFLAIRKGNSERQSNNISPTGKSKRQSSPFQQSDRKRINQPTDNEDGQEIIEHHQIEYLSVSGQILQALQKQFKKMKQTFIIDLSANQIVRIFKSTENQRAIYLSQIIKKYSIDGYCIIRLLSNRQFYLQQIKTYFSKQQIDNFDEILILLLPFYFKQHLEYSLDLENSDLNLIALESKETRESVDATNLKQSFGKSEYGTSQIYGESEAGSQDMKSQFGTSQYQNGTTQLKKSNYGQSQLGRSQYANSVYANSQMGDSVYASSQYDNQNGTRQTHRNSLAESVMGQSIVYNNQTKKQKRKQVGTSSIEDTQIILKLKQVALQLPFNLFKMDPLQNITITTLNYPFTLNFQKPKNHQEFVNNLKKSVTQLHKSSNQTICSKQFNITGAKFGRSQQNDFRYPDELSISGKHAQIGFWDNKYQIVDLQSKTGTFLYIPLTRPLILKDQHIIQLSNQIEIIVHILKREPNEGLIKLQFTKPENQPFYKAALKQNQTLRIGRSQKSHIKLLQQSISSKHTQIKYQNQQFKIYDCLSSTGTWLRLSKKGVKSQMFPLVQGDIIRISSKRTYLIQKMTNDFQTDDDLQQMQELMQNPNFKIFRQKSQDYFNGIIQTAWKRKTPYQIKNLQQKKVNPLENQ